jgi:hypothetical protein
MGSSLFLLDEFCICTNLIKASPCTNQLLHVIEHAGKLIFLQSLLMINDCFRKWYVVFHF